MARAKRAVWMELAEAAFTDALHDESDEYHELAKAYFAGESLTPHMDMLKQEAAYWYGVSLQGGYMISDEEARSVKQWCERRGISPQ